MRSRIIRFGKRSNRKDYFTGTEPHGLRCSVLLDSKEGPTVCPTPAEILYQPIWSAEGALNGALVAIFSFCSTHAEAVKDQFGWGIEKYTVPRFWGVQDWKAAMNADDFVGVCCYCDNVLKPRNYLGWVGVYLLGVLPGSESVFLTILHGCPTHHPALVGEIDSQIGIFTCPMCGRRREPNLKPEPSKIVSIPASMEGKSGTNRITPSISVDCAPESVDSSLSISADYHEGEAS